MKRLSPFFLILGPCLMAGCSSYETDFDCPTGKGLSCASLSEVNRQINEGLLGEDEAIISRSPSCDAGSSCRAKGLPQERTRGVYYPPQTLPSGEVIPGRLARVRGEG